MTRVALVVGVSGVGKSYVIGRFAANVSFVHVQASYLLRQAKAELVARPVDREELRTGQVLDNQALLVEAFGKLRAVESRPIIFDAHNIVDTDDGYAEIPLEVFRTIDPYVVIAISDDPEGILARRNRDTGRARPDRTASQIAEYQSLVISLAERHARELGVPYHLVSSGDDEAFARGILVQPWMAP
nr:AAA family ATPase [Aminobacter sp. MDW-2]